jgi:hypothetical protein
MKLISTLILLSSVLAIGNAAATTYSFDTTYPSGSQGAGDISAFSATYNNDSEVLGWSTTIEREAGNLANGFWMVLSDGENPKNDVNEYAIVYGDGLTGDLTAYTYNGINSSDSWATPGDYIETFTDVLTMDTSVADEVTFSFSIDATGVNDHDPDNGLVATDDWDGINFDEHIGIWFHAVVFDGAGPTYDNDGKLTSFPYSSQSWYDASWQATTVVPVPAAVWLFGSALVGLLGFTRRKPSA